MSSTVIHQEMTIESILALFPQRSQKLAQAITRAGLHCIGCGAAQWETLEQGMQGHGKTADETVALVSELNRILAEPLELNTIQLTERAAIKFKSIREAEGHPEASLRLGEEEGGCSGFQYLLDFSEGKLPTDEVYTSHGVDIHVDRAQLSHLLGCEIDFIDSLHSGGFKISNPNVRQGCGCGNSQGY